MKPAWDTNHDGLREIFCAAIAGITANPHFFGAGMQQSPEAAVEFANAVVEAALRNNGNRPRRGESSPTPKEPQP